MNTIIYTLSDGNTIRYIGKTNQIEKRYKQHINESSLLRTHKEKWINQILKNGGNVIIEELESCHDSISDNIESYWISQFKSWGFNLVNGTDGGEGGSPMQGKRHSDITKLKMSETAKNRPNNIGGWNKGLKMSNEFKEKISQATKGRIVNDETKLRISKSLKGKKKKPMSEETKLKISQKKKGLTSPNKGNKYSDEKKRQMSESKIGKKRSEKDKLILSESKKVIWKIENHNGEIMDFFGYDSFKDYVKNNSIPVSVTTLKSYGKNKGWKIIKKIKK